MIKKSSSSTNSVTSCPTPAACRASWIGALRLGSLIVPVKAYPAISTPDSRLHQVHTQCGQRIEYRRCCPKHGEIRAEEITKAYAYAADRLIQLTADDLGVVASPDDKTSFWNDSSSRTSSIWPCLQGGACTWPRKTSLVLCYMGPCWSHLRTRRSPCCRVNR